MTGNTPTVCIVDDDESIRNALLFLMKAEKIPAVAYPSAQKFLEDIPKTTIGALILDVRMPGMSGMELQKQLQRRKQFIPIIFITGHGDVDMAVDAMKEGAVDFVEKPFVNERLLDSVRRCFEMGRHQGKGESLCDMDAQQLLKQLTPREHEVLDELVAGKTNKAVAKSLNISPRTVEVHRSNIMDKLQIKSLPELVRLVLKAYPDIR